MQATLAMDIDPTTGKADLVFRGGTLVLDTTPRTPAIVSLLCDRRARPDDTLPLIEAPVLEPDILDPRRGWPLDGLDPQGQRAGSRFWLLLRALETDETRRRGAFYAREALAWADRKGLSVASAWARHGWLQVTCRIGRDDIVIDRPVT